jgi:hypothetical protein
MATPDTPTAEEFREALETYMDVVLTLSRGMLRAASGLDMPPLLARLPTTEDVLLLSATLLVSAAEKGERRVATVKVNRWWKAQASKT